METDKEDSLYLWTLERITAINLRDAMASGDMELSDPWADVLGMLLELRNKLIESGSTTGYYDVEASEWLPVLAKMFKSISN